MALACATSEAHEAGGTETGSETWMSTYFRKVLKTVTDKTTGEIRQVMYCDCKLLKPNKSPCDTSYVYVPKYGTVRLHRRDQESSTF